MFEAELDHIGPTVRGEVVEILTSWQRKGRAEGREEGLEKGLERGLEEGRQSQIELVTFLLTSQLGPLPVQLNYQVQGLALFQLEQLGKQALAMDVVSELADWLTALEAAEGFDGEKSDILAQVRQQVGAIAPKQKQKLLSLSPEQWRVLADLKLENVDVLDGWLLSAIHSGS